MILRLTNQTLVLAILSCAATICASPAGADAVDQSVNSAAVEIGRSGPEAQKAPSDATTSRRQSGFGHSTVQIVDDA